MASPARRAALLVFGFAAFYIVFARVALHGFPFSGDEYSYLLQAELFAKGCLHAPAPPHAGLLAVDHVVIDQWVRSKYPPGTSALLALGVLAGAPWVVTPLEGALALALVWLATRKVLGERDALLTLALVGAAPLFAFQASTFFSQTPATLWLAAAFAGVSAWTVDARARWMVAAGAAMGCAFLTRPLDAFVFGAALLALRSASAVVAAGCGAAPFIGLHFLYQWLQFGSPLRDGYHAYEPEFRALYGHAATPSLSIANFFSPEQLWHHLDVTRAFIVDWTVPGTALLAVLGAVALRDRALAWRARTFVFAWIGLTGASLLFTFADYDDGARPRYLSTALIGVAWLAAPGWRVAAEWLERQLGAGLARAAGIVVWLVAPLQLGAFLVVRTPALWVREGLAQAVAARGIHDGVVVVRAEYPTRYARNGPFFDRPVLYVSAPATMGLGEISAAFPARPLYEAREGQVWNIERVR